MYYATDDKGYRAGESRLRRIWLLVALMGLIWSRVAEAAPARRGESDEIPPELRSWVPWVLADLGGQLCPELGGEKTCVWPGRLSLELEERGGEFELDFEADADAMAMLVGGEGAWPERVELDRKDAPVLVWQGHPAVQVSRGRHTVKGRFRWAQLPETLDVGPYTAFIDLSVAGKSVPLVKRESGKIWLKGLGLEAQAEPEPEQVKLSVFRQIRDGVPLIVETLMVFQVAGKARELTLAAPLLPGTQPLGVTADLAVALEASGALRVQLVPGRHEVTLLARHAAYPSELKNQQRGAPWPPEEIWTFSPNPTLRTVEVAGLPGIDASRTELPAQWRTEGAYVASGDAVLTLATTRRGQEQQQRNQLSLQRELWLDEAAQVFTVRDHLSGQMHQDWRLELLTGSLGSVTLRGQSQLITRRAEGSAGVEVRDGQVDLTAISRVPRAGKVRAVGWSEDVEQLSARLHLPPGWDLFTASGVDETSETWLARWDLFDVFYLLVVSFAMFRLTGWGGGLAAAVALLLCRGEPGAPEYLWLPWVAAGALLTLLKAGTVRSVVRACFFGLGLSLVISLVSFSVDQVRGALYPHLVGDFSAADDFTGALTEAEPAAAPRQEASPAELELVEEADVAPALPASPMSKPVRAKAKKGYGGASADRRAFGMIGSGASAQQKQYKPGSVVQTGPGVPEATGRSVNLSWSGPVVKEHELGLFLISPGVNRLLTALRLLAVGGFLWLLYRRVARRGDPGGSGPTASVPRGDEAAAPAATGEASPPDAAPRAQRKRLASGLLVLLLTVASALSSRVALADEPSDQRLEQLKQRLVRPPACSPNCVSVSWMKVALGKELTITTEVHAGAPVAYRLPGPASALSEVSVRVNKKRTHAVRLHSDGAYYLRLEAGVHEVELEATLNGDRVTLDVGTPPQRIAVEMEDWSVSGINERGQAAGGTLTFQRAIDSESMPKGEEKIRVAVPPFFHVERTVALGVASSVTTRITRLSAATNPEVVALRLLDGEHLTTPGVEVRDGVAEVTFPPEETERLLQSTLDVPADGDLIALSLTAPAASAGSETWHLECGVIYHCETAGVVPSSHLRNGQTLLTFEPWPEETLKVTASEPAAVEGTTLTVHKATLTLTPGVRTSRGELVMAMQTSRSLIHAVSIPPTAKLDAVSVGGVEQAVKSEGGRVRIALAPGTSQVSISWQTPGGLRSWFAAPAVNTGASGVNLRTVVELPRERWLLLAGGPSQGPALLFWGFLILIIIAAALLPRLPFSPLGKVQWLLLGLGLTQVPAFVSVFVAGWFFAVGSRRAWPTLPRVLRNAMQLALVGYTLLFLLALTGAVYEGLVSSPDMEVRGAGSGIGHLVWFEDRSTGAFSPVWALSVNIWVWRAFMLAWALWLARALLGWLRWAWAELNASGFWAPPPPASPAGPAGSANDEATEGAASVSTKVPSADDKEPAAVTALASVPPGGATGVASPSRSAPAAVSESEGRSSLGLTSRAPAASAPAPASSSVAPKPVTASVPATARPSTAPAITRASLAPRSAKTSRPAPAVASDPPPVATGSDSAPPAAQRSDPLPRPPSTRPSTVPRSKKP